MVESLFKWLILSLVFISPSHHRTPEEHAVSGVIHPFFVSVTEISHNAKESTLEVSCKMFADDLETTLKAEHKTPVDLTNPKDPKQAEKMVGEYMQKHLRFTVNGKAFNIQFAGYEKENEAVWCYLQVNEVSGIKKLEILNNLLYESFDTQISIIHASVNGSRKSLRLVNPEARAIFEF